MDNEQKQENIELAASYQDETFKYARINKLTKLRQYIADLPELMRDAGIEPDHCFNHIPLGDIIKFEVNFINSKIGELFASEEDS